MTPEQFFANMQTLPIRKEDRYEETLIEDFIRTEKCGICGKHPPSTVSHIFGKGRLGNWASSLFIMPKCMECHRDYTELSLEEFERKHGVNMRLLTFLWAEKIAAYLCNKIRELQGEQKPEPKKAKVPHKPKPNPVFKKFKNRNDGLEFCKKCKLPSYPKDEIRHKAECVELQSNSEQ